MLRISEVGESIGAEELESYARDQGVQVGEGDILLFRTGWLENYSVDLAMDFCKSNPGLGLQQRSSLVRTMLWHRAVNLRHLEQFQISLNSHSF